MKLDVNSDLNEVEKTIADLQDFISMSSGNIHETDKNYLMEKLESFDKNLEHLKKLLEKSST